MILGDSQDIKRVSRFEALGLTSKNPVVDSPFKSKPSYRLLAVTGGAVPTVALGAVTLTPQKVGLTILGVRSVCAVQDNAGTNYARGLSLVRVQIGCPTAVINYPVANQSVAGGIVFDSNDVYYELPFEAPEVTGMSIWIPAGAPVTFTLLGESSVPFVLNDIVTGTLDIDIEY